MVIRYVSALAMGLIITTGLIFVMSTLIAMGKNPFTDEKAGQIVDFVRVKQDETVQRMERKVDKPDKPERPPEMPKPQLDPLKVKSNSLDTSFALTNNLDISADSLSSSDGEYLPIVKVAPQYPSRAQTRGVEGYVIVEYMVTKLGTTQDITVVEASPKGYFERAAIKAAQKFKYKPKVINGEPVDVAGVRNKFTFSLSNGKKR